MRQEIDLLGHTVTLERIGTDGDIQKATNLFSQLDGQVDALGVGGIDLWAVMGQRRFAISAAHKLIRHVKQTPVVDGGGLKNTLERYIGPALAAASLPQRPQRVLLTVAVDRYGMTQTFFEHGYDVACGDLMFTLGLPLAIRSQRRLHLVARLLGPLVTKLPISILYPTGDKQDQIIPKFHRWYQWADIIAGDCHYIKRHMPPDLSGKIIVTNTTTPQDITLFQQRGVSYLMTTTPRLNGRSFGTNLIEAGLTAVANKNRPLTPTELTDLLSHTNFTPTLWAIDDC